MKNLTALLISAVLSLTALGSAWASNTGSTILNADGFKRTTSGRPLYMLPGGGVPAIILGDTTAQTVTNKTIDGTLNTLLNIPASAINATPSPSPSTVMSRDGNANSGLNFVTLGAGNAFEANPDLTGVPSVANLYKNYSSSIDLGNSTGHVDGIQNYIHLSPGATTYTATNFGIDGQLTFDSASTGHLGSVIGESQAINNPSASTINGAVDGYSATINNTSTGQLGTVNGFTVTAINNSSGPMISLRGYAASLNNSGSATITQAEGFRDLISNSATANMTTANGADIQVTNSGTGAITTPTGVTIKLTNSTTGTFGNAVGVNVQAPTAGASSVWTSNAGVNILDQGNAAIPTSNNIKSAASLATHNLDITGSSNNFIQGQTNIGADSGSAQLNVTTNGASSQGVSILGSGGQTAALLLTSSNNHGFSVDANSHLISTQTTPPSALVTGNAGAGATCVVSHATDVSGVIDLTTTATSPSAGDQCDLTFNASYGVAPLCTLTAANANAAAFAVSSQVFVDSSTTTLGVAFGVADAVGHEYIWNYSCIQTQ